MTNTLPEIPGGWADQVWTVGGRELRLAVPADPNASLDDPELAEAWEDGRSDPYWLYTWPAAEPMAEVVFAEARARAARGSQDPRVGERVLELGCGTGLVGLAAAAAGLDVTFSDEQENAVRTAVHNARRNGSKTARGLRIDWFEPPRSQFDWIVGSDLIYQPELHQPLLRTVDTLLTPGGEFWLGDPGRVRLGEFLHVADEAGFRFDLYDRDNARRMAPATTEFRRVVLRRRSELSAT